MVVGFVLIGILSGLIAAGISLFMGATFGWAFAAYMAAGNAAMILAGLAVILRSYLSANNATDLCFDDDYMWIALDDGRVVGAPLEWYPGLFYASSTQRQDYELGGRKIHWNSLKECISLTDLMGCGFTPPRKPTA